MSASTPPPGAVARLQLWPTVVEGLAFRRCTGRVPATSTAPADDGDDDTPGA